MRLITIICATVLSTHIICSATTWNKHAFGPIFMGSLIAWCAVFKRADR